MVTDSKNINSVMLCSKGGSGSVSQILVCFKLFAIELFAIEISRAPNKKRMLPATTRKAKIVRKIGSGFIIVV